MVLTFESVAEILSVTIQMKATEKYCPVVLAIDYAVQSDSQSIICKTG